MDKNKPFGLILPKKAGTFRPKICNAFDSDSEDDSTSKKKFAKIPQSKPISVKTEDLSDPSIYEYDAIYDDMKAKKTAEVVSKVKKSSRYIDHLLKAADKRKKEYERRVERKMQLEREKEGDKFEDKEMFVSSTYKKKLQEREEEEERERRENQLNDMMDVTKQKDLSGFYRHFLKQSVGEEKIPVFGEKFEVKTESHGESNQEKSSARFVIKEEPISESDHEQSSAKDDSKLTHSEQQDKDYEDSDDSSSEESGKEIENSYEKSQRIEDYLKKKDNDISDRESDKRMSSGKSMEHFSKKRFSDRSSLRNFKRRERSKTISDEENEVPIKSAKMTKHVDSEHDETRDFLKNSESVESIAGKTNAVLDVDIEPCDSDNQTPEVAPSITHISNGTKAVDCNNQETKKKRNIFEKRTVGDLFDAAQTRYFQRLASRTA